MSAIASASESAVAADSQTPSVTIKMSSYVPPPFGESNSETKNDMTDILVSLSTSIEGTRPPTDVCCVVDVSGSMGIECTNGDSESHGLSILSIVKHACKTVIHSLTPQDRFSLVKYSTNASLVYELNYMTKENLLLAENAINNLNESGQTNLWDGLHEGLKSLDDQSGRMKAVLLLTDGQPNIIPPRGITNMFKQYKEANDLVCTVSTFGFGYNLDSTLLEELAIEGQGMYAFIPDGSFVGTAFVNATSNILSTAARQVIAKVSGLGDVANHVKLPGVSYTKASWGYQIPLGAVMFGQSKDFIISIPNELCDEILYQSIMIDIEYFTSGNLEKETSTFENSNNINNDNNDINVLYQGLRLRSVDMIRECSPKINKNNDSLITPEMLLLCTNKIRSIITTFENILLLENVINNQIIYNKISDLLKDFNGQILEALSCKEYYLKWGQHYLPSLSIAHQLQQCHNFKDPGVQSYGGILFKVLRETAEAIFVKLPPPIAPVYVSPYAHYGTPAAAVPAAARAPVDMSAYYNRGGGCFTGSTLVTLFDGTKKRVDQLNENDILQSFILNDNQIEIGYTTVKFVTEMKLNTPALLVTLPGGLEVTAWHPICLPSQASQGFEWVFPATLASQHPHMAYYHDLNKVKSVFNIALNESNNIQYHGILLNGIPTITLGHGIENDMIASHQYYGTQVVIDEMESLPRDSFNRVIVPSPPVPEDLPSLQQETTEILPISSY